jgi:hypothetical protein
MGQVLAQHPRPTRGPREWPGGSSRRVFSCRSSRNPSARASPESVTYVPRITCYPCDRNRFKKCRRCAPDHTKCRWANARPEPVLRYFSNATALDSVANSSDTTSRHGRCGAVYEEPPELCVLRRWWMSHVIPTYGRLSFSLLSM